MLLNRTGPELLHSSEVMLLFSQLVAILPRSLPSLVPTDLVPVRISLLPLISGRFDKQSLELCVISEVVSQL